MTVSKIWVDYNFCDTAAIPIGAIRGRRGSTPSTPDYTQILTAYEYQSEIREASLGATRKASTSMIYRGSKERDDAIFSSEGMGKRELTEGW